MQFVPCPNPPRPHQDGSVETKGLDRGTTNGGAAEDPRRIMTPPKMVRPAVPARVEKGNPPTRSSVYGFRARLLVNIAPKAAPTQVRQPATTALGFWDDVIDGKVVPREFRAGTAILTKLPGSPLNLSPKGRRNAIHRSSSNASARRNKIVSHSRSNPWSSRRSAAVRGRICLAANRVSARACLTRESR